VPLSLALSPAAGRGVEGRGEALLRLVRTRKGVIAMLKKNRRWLGKIDQVLICTAMAFCLVAGAIPSTPCHAQRLVKPEVVLPAHYPNGFNGYGRIDAIDRDLVVIDDAAYRLSPTVTYSTPEFPNALIIDFPPGALAGFLTNGRNEIISLWLIE
jgi:hypothetical protein